MLPTDESFLTKSKMALKKLREFLQPEINNHAKQTNGFDSPNADVLVSPFEDISGENIIESVTANFKVLELKRYLSLEGLTYVKIRSAFKYRWIAIKTLVILESLLGRLGVLKPEYFFILATKRG